MAESLRDKLRRLRREDGASRTVGGDAAAPSSAELTASRAPSIADEAASSAAEHDATSPSARSSPEEHAEETLNPSATSRALVHGLARRGARLAQHIERRTEARSARATSASTLHGAPAVGPVAPAAHTDVATTIGAPRALERCGRSNVAARRVEFAREHAHGAWKLEEALAADAATLALLAKDASLAEHALRDALFLDTETTGLSGGAGTYVFLVGLGSFTADGFELWQGFLGDPSEERALLLETAERIAQAPLLVTFFGKSFDRHRLEDKMRLHGVAPPFAKKPHLDLYHPLRRLYGKALPDTRLKTMERALCGVQRPNDLPGSFAPAAWFDFLAERPHRLEGVFAHNHDDVLSLVTLAAHAGRAHELAPLDASHERDVASAAEHAPALPHEPALRALGLARLLAERKEYARALDVLEQGSSCAPNELRRAHAIVASALRIRLGRLAEARAALEPWISRGLDVETALAHLDLLLAERRARLRARPDEVDHLATWTEQHAVGREHARLRSGLRRLGGPAR